MFAAFAQAEDPDEQITEALLGHGAVTGCVALDVGCGTGRFGSRLAPHAKSYVAVDASPQMARIAAENLGCRRTVAIARGERLPFADATFDRILASFLLANLPRSLRNQVLAELLRVARSSPEAAIWAVENHWHGAFQKLRGRAGGVENAEVLPLLRDHGFRVVETIRTRLRFPSPEHARVVLGMLCGEAAACALTEEPCADIDHQVVLLERAAAR
ncbi:MAG: class I SAM-dependent methyltransferase [Candidatus Schekmanbacteria bacterium]|nr:class I SAM-dependent methyltransferase [Candidatus Schekmanbacteria bacterium]